MSEDPTPKKWLTEAEAASHVEAKSEDLREMRKKKTGPAYAQKGPLVRYALADLDKWVAGMFAELDPDNSEGWEVVEPAEEVDLTNLYKKPELPSEASKLLDASGQPIGGAQEPPAVTAMPFTRGSFSVTNEHGEEVLCPDPFEGLTPEQCAGVKVTPAAFLENSGRGGEGSPLGKVAKEIQSQQGVYAKAPMLPEP